MATAVNLRKLLHRKSPELLTQFTADTASGCILVSDKSDLIPGHDSAYLINSHTSFWNYNADEDAWLQGPNTGITGTFGAGNCAEFRPISAPGGVIQPTATGGSTTTINTNLTLVRNLVGCAIHVHAGTGVGYIGTVKKNTIGANAIITLEVASGVAFDATTQYRLYGGSVWMWGAGAGTVGFGVYDRATNTWTNRSVAGIPTTWGIDGQLVSTGGLSSGGGAGLDSGTATAGAASTLTCGTKTWPVNGWTNFQLRIVSGTGAGQIRVIASSTATVLTTSAAWTVVPDATSVFRIEGNDDFMYLLGNNAVTMYRYSIAGNAWTTLAPVAARAGAMGTGGTAEWVDEVPDSAWNDGTYGNHLQAGTILRQNGRYIYSFRGGATNVLDVYDIAANTWISAVPYGNQFETFGGGSHSFDMNGLVYIHKESTGRIYRFNIAKNVLEPFAFIPHPQGSALAGDKMMGQTYKDGATKIRWLYSLGHTRREFTRFLII